MKVHGTKSIETRPKLPRVFSLWNQRQDMLNSSSIIASVCEVLSTSKAYLKFSAQYFY